MTPFLATIEEVVQQISTKTPSAEIMVDPKKLNLPGLDFSIVTQFVKNTLHAVREGQPGYVINSASKSKLTA